MLDTDGQGRHPVTGTPHGGIMAPILANVYLPDARELWFEKGVKRRCRGEAGLIRYADDVVCAFEQPEEAERFYKALGQRLGTCGLERSAAKTRVHLVASATPGSEDQLRVFGVRVSLGEGSGGERPSQPPDRADDATELPEALHPMGASRTDISVGEGCVRGSMPSSVGTQRLRAP